MQIQDIPQVNKGQVRVLVQMAMLVVEHPSPLFRVSLQVRVLVRVLCDSEGVDEGAVKGECAGDSESVGAGEGRVLLRVRISGW